MLPSQSLKAGHCCVFNYTPKSERIKTASKVDLHILAGDTCTEPTCPGSCFHTPPRRLQLRQTSSWRVAGTEHTPVASMRKQSSPPHTIFRAISWQCKHVSGLSATQTTHTHRPITPSWAHCPCLSGSVFHLYPTLSRPHPGDIQPALLALKQVLPSRPPTPYPPGSAALSSDHPLKFKELKATSCRKFPAHYLE